MSIASCRQSSIVCRTSGWSGISRSPTMFSPHASWSGKIAASRSSARHALQLRRDLAAAAHAQQRQRDRRVPAPARAEHRRIEQRLHEQRAHRLRGQVARHLLERKAVRRRQRQHDRVLGRRRLQLEIELAAEALAQRQAPGAIDAAAERRVDDELHAARFVEEALEHDRAQRSAGDPAPPSPRRGSRRSARRPARSSAERAGEPAERRVAPAGIEPRRDRLAQARHRRDSSVVRPGASPSQNGMLGGSPFASSTRTVPRSTRRMRYDVLPSWNMSPARLSTAKSSFTVPTTCACGSSTHRVVGVVGDRAAGRDRRQRRAAPPAQHAVDRVAMQVRARRPRRVSKAVGEHARDARRTRRASSVAERRRAPVQREQLVLAPFLQRDLGDDLLRQHVERLARQRDAVELAARDASSSAAQSHSSSRDSGKRRPFGVPPTAWPERPTRCRKAAIERVEPSWHTRSTSPMSMPSSSDAVATSARSSPRLSRCSASSRCSRDEAAVMRGDVLVAEALRQMARGALGETPRVDEDQRRAVLAHELGEPVVDLLPDLARHHGFERRRRQLDREIALAHMAGVDDRAVGPARGASLRSPTRKRAMSSIGFCVADSPMRISSRPASASQPLERQREVRAALVRRERMDLVDDHRARGREHLAARLAGEQDVQRLGRGDDDVRRAPAHLGALGLRRVAGAHRAADVGVGQAEALELGARCRASGTSRLRWMSFDSAFSGET